MKHVALLAAFLGIASAVAGCPAPFTQDASLSDAHDSNSIEAGTGDVASDHPPTDTGVVDTGVDVPPTCTTGTANCNGVTGDGCEVDTRSDSANCGSCGNACRASEVCSNGACGCATGTMSCGTGATAACVHLDTDNANCGSCGHACGATRTCALGSCNSNCAAGTADCNDDGADGCEVATSTDNNNCGSCGNVCPGGQSCASGSCACPAGTSPCGTGSTGSCVNFANDAANCGACGNACRATETCTSSACVSTCAAGTADCNGAGSDNCEVTLATDRANCGSCGNACVAGALCSAGACSCPAGTTMCGTGATAACVALNTDSANCGACGTVCASGQVCIGATCRAMSCPPGTTLCNGTCVTTGNDLANCGSCGHACTGSEICSGGICQLPTSPIGCADGTREAFANMTTFPNIAACGGGWTAAGIFPSPGRTATSSCATTGDDDTANASGNGCAAVDLCSAGWHICRGGEVRARTANMGCSADPYFVDGSRSSFYVASVSGTGCYECALDTNAFVSGCTPLSCSANCQSEPTLDNDIFGCGTAGLLLNSGQSSRCDGLTRSGNDNCGSLPSGGWNCGGSTMESVTVRRTPNTDGTCNGASCPTSSVCCTVTGIFGSTMTSCQTAGACSAMAGVGAPVVPSEGGVLCCR